MRYATLAAAEFNGATLARADMRNLVLDGPKFIIANGVAAAGPSLRWMTTSMRGLSTSTKARHPIRFQGITELAALRLAAVYGYTTGNSELCGLLRAAGWGMVAAVGGCSPAWLFHHLDAKRYGSALVTALAGAVCFCVTMYASMGGGAMTLKPADRSPESPAFAMCLTNDAICSNA